MRAMLLGATNSWFAVKESALSIPRYEDESIQRIHTHRAVFEGVNDLTVMAFLRGRGELNAFVDLDDQQSLDALERYRSHGEDGGLAGDIRTPEWELLTGDLKWVARFSSSLRRH